MTSLGAGLTVTPDKGALTLLVEKGDVDVSDEVAVVGGETEVIDFTLKRDGVVIDLTSATAITMRRKSYPYRQLDSTDLTGLLAIVAPATGGVVRLTPDAAFWATGVDYYVCEFVVVIGSAVTILPDPDNGHFKVVVRKPLA